MEETGRLFDAIRKGDADEVSRLVDANPSLLAAKVAGASPLLTAVYHRRSAIARLLVAKGAPLDVFEASAVGDVETLRRLLREEPSRANAVAPDGFTPLGLAAFFGHVEAARLLLATGADPKLAATNPTKVAPLHSAIAGGHVEIVRELLAHGADVHARQEGGFTPLHGAAVDGGEEAIRLLLAHGADRAARTDAGKTPAELARERGKTSAADLLS
ncbi:MAG TPA: ankyrin repeat domain-containing protein [Thermoanaerobaculia bacterium]